MSDKWKPDPDGKECAACGQWIYIPKDIPKDQLLECSHCGWSSPQDPREISPTQTPCCSCDNWIVITKEAKRIGKAVCKHCKATIILRKDQRLVDCLFCNGSGKIANIIYGNVKDCSMCNGEGKVPFVSDPM